MNAINIADEIRLFVMPMNLLSVLLLAGAYATLIKAHPTEDIGRRRFLRLATMGWIGNFSYIILEIIKYRLTLQSSPEAVSPLASILNATTLSLGTVMSWVFLEAAIPFLEYRRQLLGASRLLVIILPVLAFLPLNSRLLYVLILVPNVLYNSVAIILLAKGIEKLTVPTLGTGEKGVLRRLTVPLWSYALLQVAYLILWLPQSDHGYSLRRQALSAIAGAVGFSLAFLFKLIHLTGIVGYSTVRTIRLQRLDLEAKTIKYQRRFISEMVHELKTPAAELTLELDQLQGAVLARQGIREEVRSVREIMTRILSLVHGAYDLVSEENTQVQVLERPYSHNVNNAIQSAILSLKATLHEEGLDYHVSIETQLSQKPLVTIRRSELMQIFVNILKNSYEAIPRREGGVIQIKTRKIRALGSAGSASVQIVIEDSGVGISEHYLHRVTEYGFTTKQAPGRGHGLYICKKIVEAHNGTIEIASPVQVDRGTRVRITFPASPENR